MSLTADQAPAVTLTQPCAAVSAVSAVSAAGSEGLVHQPKHRDREERTMAHCRGLRGLSVCTLTAGGSDWSPQLLQECLQVRPSTLTLKGIVSVVSCNKSL